MLRFSQLMANGASGVVAAGTVMLATPHEAQAHSRDYPITICLTGTTAQRPQAGDPDFSIGLPGGVLYLDTTLGYIIVSDGTGLWRNPATGASV
jgi:hypothetical protein